MGGRWLDVTVKGMTGERNPLTVRLCIVAVAAGRMDGKFSMCTVFPSCVQYNTVPLSTLCLNFEGTLCSTA
jgi:hypothetical protein